MRRFFFLSLKSGKEHRVTSEELVRLNYRGSGSAWRSAVTPLSFALLLAIGVIAVGLGSNPALPHAAVSSSLPTFLAPAANHMAAVSSQTSLVRLPLIFEPNQGQTASRVQFLAHGAGHGLFLTGEGAILSMRRSGRGPEIIRMALDGVNKNPAASGDELLPGKSNYFIGNDPAKWHRDIPQFARVRYQDVYPGIDLVYYGNQGLLEYDFKVAPGVDPRQIALRFEAPQRLRLDAQGNLLLGGDVRLEAPRVYQKIGDEERSVVGHFALAGNRVTFEIGNYDRSRALIIDPVLSYSTFLGGSGNEGCSAIVPSGLPTSGCPAIAIDLGGNIYITGATTSADFPNPSAPPALKGPADAFVAKLNPAASGSAQLVYSAYIGGGGTETTAGIGVDSGFNVTVVGNTDSSDFPTTANAFQTARASSNTHAFVTKIDAAGANLLYSTFLSGTNGADFAAGGTLDARGKVYVVGTTSSTNPATTAVFPATIGSFQPTSRAANQFFMSKIDPTLSGTASLVYSTYIGGSTPSTATTSGGGIVVDSASDVYVTGGTDFTDMPVLNAFQSTLKGGQDIWVAKFNPGAASGAQLLYLTYLGGSGNDIGRGIAVDSAFNAYVTGETTNASDFPVAGMGVFQPGYGGGASDAFVAKIGAPCVTATSTCPQGTVPLNYFTYLGGTGTDVGLAIVVDTIQGATVTGWTSSSDFPLNINPPTGARTPIQGTLRGPTDAFISRIDTSAITANAAGHVGTYLGGASTDAGTSVVLDPQFTYVGGETFSGDFPTANPFQSTNHGSGDAFIARLGPVVNFALTETGSPNPVGVGNAVTFSYKIANNGDTTAGVTFTDAIATGSATSVSVTSSPGGACPSSTGSITCTLGVISAGSSTDSVTVTATPGVAGPFSDSGKLTSLGTAAIFTPPPPPVVVTVNDFSVAVAPATQAVNAGMPATYTVTVSPTGPIPNTISLSCSSSLPTGATCTFPNGASIPNLNNGSAVTRELVINTTARVTTPASLWKPGGPVYAIWFPISGLAVLGAGFRGKIARKRYVLLVLLLAGFIGLIVFQAGCSSSKSTNITTGTPAGTYPLTITATSGSASRTFPISLTVN